MPQEIKINIVEAASEVAITIMKQKFKDGGWSEETIQEFLYEEDTLDSFKLKEEYQDEFNSLYDLIFNLLYNIKV